MKGLKFYSIWIAAVCVAVLILQSAIPGFTELFMLTSNALSMPWQFVTAVFLHGGIAHLLYNLLALIIFGPILESTIGSKKFLLIYFTSGIAANIISFWWFPNALGASGAIMGILGCLAILRPTMNVWAFGMIIPMFIAAILWVGGSVLGIFGFGEQGVGHLAHLSGIVVGIAYGVFLRIKHHKRGYAVFERKVVIPEESMRSWENRHMGRF